MKTAPHTLSFYTADSMWYVRAAYEHPTQQVSELWFDHNGDWHGADELGISDERYAKYEEEAQMQHQAHMGKIGAA